MYLLLYVGSNTENIVIYVSVSDSFIGARFENAIVQIGKTNTGRQTIS